MNNGGIANLPCLCDFTCAVYDYTFNLLFDTTGTGLPSVLSLGSTVSLSAPNVPVVATYMINPTTFVLAQTVSTGLLGSILAAITSATTNIANIIGVLEVILPFLAQLGVSQTIINEVAAYLEGITGSTVPVIPGTSITISFISATNSIVITLPVVTVGDITYGPITITIPLSALLIPVYDIAHRVSFIQSCHKDENDKYFIALNF